MRLKYSKLHATRAVVQALVHKVVALVAEHAVAARTRAWAVPAAVHGAQLYLRSAPVALAAAPWHLARGSGGVPA